MRLEARKYLRDIQVAAERIERFTRGNGFEMLRSPVERSSALSSRRFHASTRIPRTSRQPFRTAAGSSLPNILIHGYAAVDGHRPSRRQGSATDDDPMPRKHHHNVYVIELDPAILNIARFRNANPERDLLKPCVYVGMTGLTPEARFAKHKAGIRANRYVQRFGLRLLPELYAYANPMPYQAARDMEVELAIALREQGYAVWQA